MSALGAMVAGHRCSGGRAMTEYVRRHGGSAEATMLGAGMKSSMELAAMANGTFAHATEYEDDSFPEAVSSYTLFPAIFALGEHLQSSGERTIEAFVAGYEAQARIGLACREARRLGYMVLSLAGSIGCAVSAAKMLGLDERKTTMAISIAASQGSGIGYQTGSTAHIVEMGFSARNGIAAALLAADRAARCSRGAAGPFPHHHRREGRGTRENPRGLGSPLSSARGRYQAFPLLLSPPANH